MLIRRVYRWKCGLLLLSSMALAPVVAQDAPARNGQPTSASRPMGPPGPDSTRWRFADAVRRDAGSLELLFMLAEPTIREDLKLADSAKANLESARADFESRLRSIATPEGKRDGDPHWLTKLVEEESKRADEFLKNNLSETQRQRLIGLFVQLRGFRALTNRCVAREVGFEGDQAKALKERIDGIRAAVMEESASRARELFESGSGPAEFEKFVLENQKKVDEQVRKSLTSEEQSKLLSLRGAELNMPQRWLVRGIAGDGPRDDRRGPRPPGDHEPRGGDRGRTDRPTPPPKSKSGKGSSGKSSSGDQCLPSTPEPSNR